MHYLPECVSSMLFSWMNNQSYKSSMHQLPECNLYYDELGWIGLNQGMHYLPECVSTLEYVVFMNK